MMERGLETMEPAESGSASHTNPLEGFAIAHESPTEIEHPVRDEDNIEWEKIPGYLKAWLDTIVVGQEELGKNFSFTEYVRNYYPELAENVRGEELSHLHRDFSLERLKWVTHLVDIGMLDEVNPETAFAIIAKVIKGRDPVEFMLAAYDGQVGYQDLSGEAAICDQEMVMRNPGETQDKLKALLFGNYREGDYPSPDNANHSRHTRTGQLLGYPYEKIKPAMGQIYTSIREVEAKKETLENYGRDFYAYGIQMLSLAIHPIEDCNARTCALFGLEVRHRIDASPETYDETPTFFRTADNEALDKDPRFSPVTEQRKVASAQFRRGLTQAFLEELSRTAPEKRNITGLSADIMGSHERDETEIDVEKELQRLGNWVGSLPPGSHSLTGEEEMIRKKNDISISRLIESNPEVLLRVSQRVVNLIQELALDTQTEENIYEVMRGKDCTGTEQQILEALWITTHIERKAIEDPTQVQELLSEIQTKGADVEEYIFKMRVQSGNLHPEEKAHIGI